MKKPIIMVILLLVAISAWFLFSPSSLEKNGEPLTLYGNVDIREVQLGFRVGGRLQAMLPEEGDRVQPGTHLASLDKVPFTDALAADEAQLEMARAELEQLENGSRPQELALARARVQESSALLQRAGQDLRRQRQLVEENVGSQRELDAALARHAQVEAQLALQRAQLDLAIEGPRQESIAAARAALARARARLAQGQTRLEDTDLYAPAAGTIMTRVREPGSIIAAGESVYVLSLTDTVYVRAYVNEGMLGLVKPGKKVLVSTDSSAREYEGQVGFVSVRAEFTPKTVETPELRTDLVYRLRIVVSEADEGLRQGMPVTVRMSGESGSGDEHSD